MTKTNNVLSCNFCGQKKQMDGSVRLVGTEDGESMICLRCLTIASEALRYHESLGTPSKIIRPRILNEPDNSD